VNFAGTTNGELQKQFDALLKRAHMLTHSQPYTAPKKAKAKAILAKAGLISDELRRRAAAMQGIGETVKNVAHNTVTAAGKTVGGIVGDTVSAVVSGSGLALPLLLVAAYMLFIRGK